MIISQLHFQKKNEHFSIQLHEMRNHFAVVIVKNGQQYLRRNSPVHTILYQGESDIEAVSCYEDAIKPHLQKKEQLQHMVKAETPCLEVQAKVDTTKAKKFLGNFLKENM